MSRRDQRGSNASGGKWKERSEDVIRGKSEREKTRQGQGSTRGRDIKGRAAQTEREGCKAKVEELGCRADVPFLIPPVRGFVPRPSRKKELGRQQLTKEL